MSTAFPGPLPRVPLDDTAVFGRRWVSSHMPPHASLSLPRLTTLIASIIVALCSGTNYVRYPIHAVLAR